MSLDGKIATSAGESRWITSPEARAFGGRLRREVDAILVGVGTVLADDPELTDRGRTARGRPLLRVVLDGRLRTPVGSRLASTARDVPLLLLCAPGAPASRRRRLEAAGAEVIEVPAAPDGLDLGAVLDLLGRRDVLGLLVEGGSSVSGSFVRGELVDKVYFVVAPIVIGGKGALPAFGGPGFDRLADAPRFTLARELRAGPDRILEAYPAYSRSIAAPTRPRAAAPSGAPGRAPSSRRR
jgi:diaminohydroxyphosphoribosylaminopyrimidine deaminase/5-amino-6-(5-phosphoribosylamino)uracil reductase